MASEEGRRMGTRAQKLSKNPKINRVIKGRFYAFDHQMQIGKIDDGDELHVLIS